MRRNEKPKTTHNQKSESRVDPGYYVLPVPSDGRCRVMDGANAL